ncbi:MAG: hypothetical protein GF372_12910 [Candidatus Marinimicrobia bacterium]|nr:hypothetical protein [Candidatus Neomarinimicrobiota bacterium]
MTPFNQSIFKRIISSAIAVFIIGMAVSAMAQTVQVNSIKPDYRDEHIVLQIRTDGEAQYRLSELSRNRLELTVYNTVHSDLKQAPSILWQFMPTEAIDVQEKNQNTYITFRLKSRSSYEVFHESAKDHILLNIGGELAKEFRKNVIHFGSQHFEQLQAPQRKVLISVLQDAEFDSRDSFLLSELQVALNNGQIVWYEEIYEQVRGRSTLSQDQLLQLANFYEAQGDLAEAERTWFDYYQRTERQLNANYTDSLPASSLIKYSDGGNNVISGLITWMQGLFAQDFLISLFSIVFVMAALIGGYLAYDHRNELKQKFAHSKTSLDKKKTIDTDTVKGAAASPFDNFLKEMQDKVEDIPSEQVKDEPEPLVSEEMSENSDPDIETEDAVYTSEEAEQSLEEFQEFANASSTKKNNVLRQAEVVDLYKMSVEPEVIAKNLNMSRSEVELLLKISGTVSETKTTTRKRKIQYDDSFADMSLNDMAQVMQISVEEAKLLRLKGQREHYSA